MVPKNMFDGPEPPPDLYLFFYASIDLMAEWLNPTLLLDDVSVNGFLHSRPYMTERAAELFDNFIINVWGVPELPRLRRRLPGLPRPTAPPTRRRRSGSPAARRSRQVIEPLERALAAAGVEIVRRHRGRRRLLLGGPGAGDRACATRSERACARESGRRAGPGRAPGRADPDRALGRRAAGGWSRRAPELAEISRLRAQPVPILYLFLKRRLHVPAEPVGLAGSRFGLAFTDISQTWQGVPELRRPHRAGALRLRPVRAARHRRRGRRDGDAARGCRAISTSDAGGGWGDSPTIDWELTRFASNDDTQLFVNETGSDVYRPPTDCRELAEPVATRVTSLRQPDRDDDDRVRGHERARGRARRSSPGAAAGPWRSTSRARCPSALWVWLRYACMPYAAGASSRSWSATCSRALLRRLQR